MTLMIITFIFISFYHRFKSSSVCIKKGHYCIFYFFNFEYNFWWSKFRRMKLGMLSAGISQSEVVRRFNCNQGIGRFPPGQISPGKFPPRQFPTRTIPHQDNSPPGHCAVPIAPRILKLYQKLLNNILYWNPEGFLDTFIVKKMTGSLKPLN